MFILIRLLILIFIVGISNAQISKENITLNGDFSADYNFIRAGLDESLENEKQLMSLEKYINVNFNKTYIEKDPLLLAFQGTIESLKAKFVFWPFTKLNHLNRGLELLDKAVNLAPSNLEVRYLRFCVLDNIPSIIGYGDKAQEDADILFNLFKQSDSYNSDTLIISMAETLNESERFTALQKNSFQKILFKRK